jgi:hypothetical protein
MQCCEYGPWSLTFECICIWLKPKYLNYMIAAVSVRHNLPYLLVSSGEKRSSLPTESVTLEISELYLVDPKGTLYKFQLPTSQKTDYDKFKLYELS